MIDYRLSLKAFGLSATLCDSAAPANLLIIDATVPVGRRICCTGQNDGKAADRGDALRRGQC
ncbi:Uncharacterised protein [Raoultella terrigena]|uniref:Uncharacterized protein n=1 Tax=Raoultella terrigena TaxID=577 RepID=A0A4V6J1R5_RAOTE|nr:Uncharacterised protein [Raoultella terrigena]